MPHNKSWQTAFLTATPRLIEQYETNEMRLFEDPVIKHFHSKFTLFVMQFKMIRDLEGLMLDSFSKGTIGLILCRTKYIDDVLQIGMDNGIKQVVILGAGLDTRPYRMDGINQVKVVEADLPIMQKLKKSKVETCLGELPSHVTYCAIDFNHQLLEDVLTPQVLDIEQPSLFIWEGVTQYITEEGVRNTLRFISKMPTGSAVVFSYVVKNVIDKTSDIAGINDVMDYFSTKNQEWTFGIDPSDISEFLRPFDLIPIENVGNSYYQERYLRPRGRKLEVSEIERIVYAQKI